MASLMAIFQTASKRYVIKAFTEPIARDNARVFMPARKRVTLEQWGSFFRWIRPTVNKPVAR